VEYFRNRGAYCRQVSVGVLLSVPLTGKKSSEGLRTTWYTQLTANHRTVAITRTISICSSTGARLNARNAYRRKRAFGKNLAMRQGR
jgi:hypothetical protein